MNDFLNKLFNLPQGSPGIKEALGILSQDRVNKKQKSIADDYNIDYIPTKYGKTDSWQRLQEWFNQAQQERGQESNPVPVAPVQEPLISQEVWESQPAFQPQPQEQPQVLGASGMGVPQSIYDYATQYKYSPGGEFGQSRLNDQNLSTLWESINNNYPDLDVKTKEALLANLVAVAQAESGMGGAYGNPEAGNYKDSNYWNWFAGGDRNFDPESFEEMANIITKGIGGYTLGTGGKFTRDNASTYTGNDNLSFWYDQIYNPAMRAMGY